MSIDRLFKKNQGATSIEYGIVVSSVLTLAALVGLGIGAVYGIKALAKYANAPVVERANVYGESQVETFIDRDGKRFYAEIDGKPIEAYLKDRK